MALQYTRNMPKAAFTTLGCKVNQYETQRILDSFEGRGFEIVAFDEVADVYVINSCSVTAIAESKSRYTIRRANRLNPNAKVVVTGCAAQMAINMSQSLDGADLVVPNPEKLLTLVRFEEAFPELKPSEPSTIAHPPAGRTRATLKIQDGCSVMCSYCSIPFTRPGMVSRHAPEVLEEARQMVARGYLEIVLTGVLIGAYGPESGSGGPNFEELVEAIAQRIYPARLRISSIEMRQVTSRLIELIERGLVVPHLHIPLQAGDDQVLSDMNRPYTRREYIDLCAELKRRIPEISLTTDIMVGFPTETAECFQSTVALCEEVGFLKIHSFRFSPRPGTPADTFGDPVSPEEKVRRSSVLAEIGGRSASVHTAKFTGRTLRVLVEGRVSRDGLLSGLTDNYLEVHFAGSAELQRQFAHIRVEEYREGKLYGELVTDRSNQIALSK